MDQTLFPEQRPNNINEIPIRWGLIITAVTCVLSTINFMFLASSFISFMVVLVLTYILMYVMYFLTAKAQRTAFGGYITFKEAFRAIFIALLISSVIGGIYGIIYAKFIDPDSLNRMKDAMLAFMTKFNTPADKIDEAARNFDEKTAQSMKPGRMVLSFAQTIVTNSIFGLICAAIAKKKKPEL